MPSKNMMTKKEKRELAVKKDKETKYNTSLLEFTIEIAKIKAPDFKKREDVERVCTQYLQLCVDKNIKPSVSGFATALGTNRTTLLNWLNGSAKVENREIILKAYSMIETFDEIAMKEGKIPPIIAIFNAKNNYGYSDKTDVKIISDEMSDEEIERRYRDMHEVVSEQ